MRRTLEVELGDLQHDCIVRCPGVAFELLKSITGRPPVWIALRRGFACQRRTALDAVAAGERMGLDVVVTGPRSAPPADPPAGPASPVSGEGPEMRPAGGLW